LRSSFSSIMRGRHRHHHGVSVSHQPESPPDHIHLSQLHFPTPLPPPVIRTPPTTFLSLDQRRPNDPEMQVSHESIYRSLFRADSRWVAQRTHRSPAHQACDSASGGTRQPDGRGLRPNILNISERPAEAADRAVPGHWESPCFCQAAGASAGRGGSW